MNDKITQTLTHIEKTFFDAGLRLIREHPDWNPSTDSRIIVFAKCTNVISCVKLGLVFSSEYLAVEEWWRKHPILINGIDNHPNRAYDFEVFMKVAFIQGMFALQEAALRRFLREIDSTACNRGAAEFESIRAALFSRITLSDVAKDTYRSLMELWREIRNAIHNNMVYYHALRNHRIVTYRGKMYGFEVDKPLDFIRWKLLLLLGTDLGSMLTDIVNTPEISAPTAIYDPANFNLGH